MLVTELLLQESGKIEPRDQEECAGREEHVRSQLQVWDRAEEDLEATPDDLEAEQRKQGSHHQNDVMHNLKPL